MRSSRSEHGTASTMLYQSPQRCRRPGSATSHGDASWNPELASNNQDRQHYGDHQEDYAYPQTEIKLPHPRIGSIHDRRLIRHGIDMVPPWRGFGECRFTAGGCSPGSPGFFRHLVLSRDVPARACATADGSARTLAGAPDRGVGIFLLSPVSRLIRLP